ncbi:MAG TPA: carboxypeptidase-like regulatory domain-containing protein [Cytophagales bacterium]|nr:carboxypeptidase-like regulatory domain-containing protein [Cytophagales bacterium]
MKTLSISIFFICISAYGQITGKVVDKATQHPLKGANVIILGTTNGTMTDDQGSFSFDKKYKKSVAVISYLGYKNNQVKLDPKSESIIELEKAYTLLPQMNVGLGEYTGPKEYNERPKPKEDLNDLPEEEVDELFVTVESPASFYQGENNLYAYVASNFQYPKRVLDENLSGQVYVQFTILPSGKPDKIIFLTEDIPLEVQTELKRLVEAMPHWTAAEQRGQKVEQGFILNIKYAASGQ